MQIGYVVSNGADISTRIHTIEHIKGAFEAIVPVVELPANLKARMTAKVTAADLVAANLGAGKYIVGQSKVSPDDNLGGLKVLLAREGAMLGTTEGDATSNAQWTKLIAVVNQIVGQGYALHSGDLVLCGPVGQALEAKPGKYHADFGALGALDFELK
jgi:2-keto-4-pentenoate hydratase